MKLRVESSPRRRRRVEWVEIVERFRRSGMTRKAFAEQNGVGVSTLGYWLRRIEPGSEENQREIVERDGSGTGSPGTAHVFREVEMSSLFSETPCGWAMEVVNSRGLRMRFRQALGMDEIERLLDQC